MPSFTPGLRLHDRFTLVERLGAGGMSQVWRAVDEVLGRSVAVKVLDSSLADEPALQQATWREARAAARLAHPHVVRVYDYGEAALPGGALMPYLVMELVEGESLAARLRAGRLAWHEAVRIGAQVAAALAAAHRIGVVHRDVKPANVMLTPGGAKVLDFGIAGLAGTRSDDGGLLVGTPAYAAPEQLHSSLPQRASDIYALGVLLYEALTGRVPVPMATWEDVLDAQRDGRAVPPPQVPGLPPQVTRLVMAALSADPAQRPSAEQIATGLAAVIGLPDPIAALEDRTAAMPMVPGPSDRAGFAPGAARPSDGAGFARGAARPASPPTMVADPAAMAGPADPPRRRGPRPLLVAVVGALVAAGLAVAVVASALHSDPPASQSPQAGAPAPATSAPATSEPPPSPASEAVPTSPDAILTELDRVIADAAAGGGLGDNVAEQLSDRVEGLRDAVAAQGDNRGKGNKRKRDDELQRKIGDLTDRIGELHTDGDIDEQTADRLDTLLRALSATQPGSGD